MLAVLWLLLLTVSGQRTGPFQRGSLGSRKKSILVKGKEFTIFQERMDWGSAAKKCRQEGLELARVENLFQAVRIFAAAGTYTWVGLRTKSGKDGVWRWMNGDKSFRDNTPWGAIQPNDEGDVLCGYIAIRKGSLADTDCNKKYMVACSALTDSQPKLQPAIIPNQSLLRSQIVNLPEEPVSEEPASEEPTFENPVSETSEEKTADEAPVAGATAPDWQNVHKKHLDLSRNGGNGRYGRIKDPLFASKKNLGREIFVNYDTDGNTITDFTDTIDPEIEYVEADGVLMFHLGPFFYNAAQFNTVFSTTMTPFLGGRQFCIIWPPKLFLQTTSFISF